MALRRQIAASLAVATAALAFTACGEDSPQGPKIPRETADALIEELEEVENNIDEGDCEGDSSTAPTALADVRAQVDEAAEGIDPELVADLEELLDRLEGQVSDFCAGLDDADDEESTSSSTTTTTETSTDTTDEESTTSTDEDEEETKETTTEEPDVTTPEPPEPEPTPPGNGPDGEGPPGQDGGFETDDGGIAPERGDSASSAGGEG